MGSLEYALIQYGRCPYKNRRLGYRQQHTWHHVKAAAEDSHLQVMERGLRVNNLADTLVLDF